MSENVQICERIAHNFYAQLLWLQGIAGDRHSEKLWSHLHPVSGSISPLGYGKMTESKFLFPLAADIRYRPWKLNPQADKPNSMYIDKNIFWGCLAAWSRQDAYFFSVSAQANINN